MSAKNDIVRQQRRWAESAGIAVDARAYVRSPCDNLCNPLAANVLLELQGGSELEPAATRPARMWWLASSAALVVNVFDHWRQANPAPLLKALGVEPQLRGLSFETVFSTGLEGDPPCVDVALRLASGAVVAIESKFTEWLVPRPRNKAMLKAKYFPDDRPLWTSRSLPACQSLAQDIQQRRERFKFLHAAQLLKHALGLGTQLAGEFAIYYVYYDVPGTASAQHAAEVERFASRVGPELRFKALTYQDLYRALRASDEVDRSYLEYLRARYFPRIA